MAESLVKKLAAYAAGLVGTRPFKCFVMIEDDDGSRFWSADGKLRSEFVQARRLENRDWGMTQVDIGHPPAAAAQQLPQQLQWAETTTMTMRTSMMTADDFTEPWNNTAAGSGPNNSLLEGYSAPFARHDSLRGGAGHRPPRGMSARGNHGRAICGGGNPGGFDRIGRGCGPLALGSAAPSSARTEGPRGPKRTRWDMVAKPLMAAASASSDDYLDPADADASAAASGAAAAAAAVKTQRRKKERQRQYEREQRKKLEALASKDPEAAESVTCQSRGFLKFKQYKTDDDLKDRLMNLSDKESTFNLADDESGGARPSITNAAAANNADSTSKSASTSIIEGAPKSAGASNSASAPKSAGVPKEVPSLNGAGSRNDHSVAPLLDAGNAKRRLPASNSDNFGRSENSGHVGSSERSARVGSSERSARVGSSESSARADSSSAHFGQDYYPRPDDDADLALPPTPGVNGGNTLRLTPGINRGNTPRQTSGIDWGNTPRQKPGLNGGNTQTVKRRLKRQRAEERRQAELLSQLSSDGTSKPDLMGLGGL